MNSRRSRKRRASSFLVLFLVLLLTVNPVMPAKAYALPSIEDLVNEALEQTGMKDLADDVAETLEDTVNGTLPVLEKVPEMVMDDTKAKAEEAAAQLSVIMPVLREIAETGNVVTEILGAVPIDFDVDVAVPMPGDLGNDMGAKAWAKKQGDYISLCIWVDGPGRSQAVFGIANDDPLGGGNAPHFENSGHITTAFYDMTPNGRDYVHARLPLGMDMPTVYARGYIPWGSKDEQYIKVEIGGMTDTQVNLNFEVSLKGTADAEVSIEGEAKASFSVGVSPQEAQKVANRTMITMNRALIAEAEKGELGPEAAARVIKAAIGQLKACSAENPGAIGSVTLGVDIAGLVGLGVADSVWPGISASGGLYLELPLDAAANIGLDALDGLLENTELMANDIHRIASCVLSGDLSSETLNEVTARLRNSWENGAKPVFENIVNDTVGAVAQTSVGISLSLDLAGEGSTSGGGDGGTESSFNLFAADASIPGGEALVAAANGEFISDTVEGLALFLGNMLSGNVDRDVPDQLDRLDEVVDNLAEGTVLRLDICTPLYVQLTAELSARPLVEASKTSIECLRGLNRAMLHAAREGSLEPLRNIENYIQGGKEHLLEFIKSISGSMFGLDLGIGASADLGAEATVTVDGGASVYMKANPEMIFFVTSLGELQFDDVTGLAQAGIDISVGASGGVNLGEGVELGVQGGASVDTSLLKLLLEEHHGPIDDLYTVKGSSNANLGELTVTVGGKQRNLIPELNDTDTSYTAYVPYNTNLVTIEAKPQSPGAKVRFWGLDTNRYTEDLNGYNMLVPITVWAEDGTMKEYQLSVLQGPSIKLRSLSSPNDSLYFSPDQFSPDQNNYVINVPLYRTDIEFVPVLDHIGATLKVNGVPWSSGQTFKAPLNVGENIITFEVGDYMDTNTYTVKVNRAPSSDATLAYLSVNQGTLDPAFDKNTTSYTVSVGEDVASIAIYADVNEPHATATLYKVDGNQREELQSQLYGIRKTVEIQPGENSFEIVVTAQDGTTRETYSLNVFRTNVPLKRLAVRIGDGAGAQNIELTPSSLGHGLDLNSDSNVYITAEPISENVKVYIGNAVVTKEDGWTANLGQIREDQQVSIPVTVRTLADLKRTDYVIRFNLSNQDMGLESVRFVYKDQSGNDQTVVPSSGTDGFHAEVPSYVDHIKVYATPEYTTGNNPAYTFVNHMIDYAGSTVFVDHSVPGVTVSLGVEMNTIPITVVAANGNTSTYNLYVTRPTPPEMIADLTSISANCGSFDHAFDPRITSYFLTIPYQPDEDANSTTYPGWPSSVIITLACASDGSTFQVPTQYVWRKYKVHGDKGSQNPLLYEIHVENIYTWDPIPVQFSVTSPNGQVSKVYNITIQRSPSANAWLDPNSGLQVSIDKNSIESLNPVSYPFNLAYTVNVGSEVDKIYLRAKPWYPGASLTINGATAEYQYDDVNSPYPVQYCEWREVPLSAGANKVEVAVTAPNGKNTKTYTVTINRAAPPDTAPPSIGVPVNITVEATSSAGAVVNFNARAIDAVDGEVPVTYSKNPGSVFPVGDTAVTVTAQDQAGNTATAGFTVKVQDTTPPSFGPVGDVEVDAAGSGGAAVNFSVTATDLVDGPVEVMYSRTPGSVFPVGTTRVTCMAEDSRGNAAIKTFNVTVIGQTVENAVISSDAADFDKNIANQADVETTITWNSATAVTDVKKAGASIGMENYAVNGNILTIKKEYLATQPTGGLVLTVEFDRGNAATLAINILDTTPQIISATISPTTVTFDLDSPGDVSTTISWGSAATVTDVVYGSVYLTSPADYNVSGNTLTIKETCLSGLNLTDGNSIDFEISFNAGDSAVLTVNAVSSYVPSGDAALSDLRVGGETVAGFVYKQYEYTVQLPYGTQPGSPAAFVSATPNDSRANVRITQAASLPGAAKVEVTAEDGTVLTYTIHFTVAEPPLSSNASLSGLTLSAGSLSFAPDTVSYTLSVANGVTSTTVTPVAADANARVQVNGKDVESGRSSEPIALKVGSNTIAIVVTAQDGVTVRTYTVTVNRAAAPSRDRDDDRGSGGTSTLQPQPVQPPAATVGGLKTTATVDAATGTVKTELDADALNMALEGALTGDDGKKTLEVELSKSATGSYNVEFPASALSNPQADINIEIKTDAGTVTLPGNMLAGTGFENQGDAGLTIKNVDKSTLPEEVRNAVGDKPVIQLGLTVDGEQKAWNNPDAPVTVSIPYTPTAAELADPEHIVVWYIDGSGNVISVPNGRYDPATGTVTFTTTHFSYYAVVYKQVSFKDVAKDAWYSKAVSFIAAREITTGTGGGNFSPEAKLTRGQFIVMLLKAYGIAPDENPQDNFADAGNTWYTGYLAAAKRTGISAGVGGNVFAPEKEITRQEMFTLLYNALKVIGRLPEGDSGKRLSDFSDTGEIAPWSKEAMKLLVETGTIGGSGGKLLPKDTTTRAQMAQVLYNLLTK
ncbi:multidomain protein with s-layer homology region, hyr domain [Heliomicrobium modesticaldum Ice1]|uniref:Multidomain protein with s-layer homology region, hyr domain n=1 Tax=Heliobacterium modesticaldum (strain ATCC 51547 / Ice1) TaxID=498761 RepID=B0TD61_HELMI|nr:cadherin-like beta sandwich domain-containing protein [Heliomicrobium modesticaldum]ABZ82759.1 multidomain protein with s-layer homology region, hyr domain [Heliomicrobium modesticaldum Ice1]